MTSKHHRLIIDSCDTMVDLDLRVKRTISVRVVLRDVRCPRCNGQGRPRIIALSQRTVDLKVFSKKPSASVCPLSAVKQTSAGLSQCPLLAQSGVEDVRFRVGSGHQDLTPNVC